jgi:hypothetical protein
MEKIPFSEEKRNLDNNLRMLRGFICPFYPFKAPTGPTAVPECDFILSFIPLVPTLFLHYFTQTTGGIRIWTLSPLTLKKE